MAAASQRGLQQTRGSQAAGPYGSPAPKNGTSGAAAGNPARLRSVRRRGGPGDADEACVARAPDGRRGSVRRVSRRRRERLGFTPAPEGRSVSAFSSVTRRTRGGLPRGDGPTWMRCRAAGEPGPCGTGPVFRSWRAAPHWQPPPTCPRRSAGERTGGQRDSEAGGPRRPRGGEATTAGGGRPGGG